MHKKTENATMLNINGLPDPSYRYKMPKLDTNWRKNNKTYFKNLDKVAESLNRTSVEIIKWYGYTLGVNANIKDHSLNGQYDTKKLQRLFQEYIDNHIICGVCKNPETTYSIVKSKLGKQCASCGGLSKVKVHPKMKKMFKIK